MRKAIWALPLATVIAATIGIPSASAATGALTVSNLYDSSSDSQYSHVPDMHVGDCHLDSNLVIPRPSTGGVARLKFFFTSSTDSTSNYDQWHSSWKFVDANNNLLLTVDTTDGLRMRNTHSSYVGEIDQTIAMSISDWAHISRVVWNGAC